VGDFHISPEIKSFLFFPKFCYHWLEFCMRIIGGGSLAGWAPGPKYWGGSSPSGPMKSAPMSTFVMNTRHYYWAKHWISYRPTVPFCSKLTLTMHAVWYIGMTTSIVMQYSSNDPACNNNNNDWSIVMVYSVLFDCIVHCRLCREDWERLTRERNAVPPWEQHII